MSEIKNRIITMSGDPGSGKSTIIGQLKKDYEEKGYKVHIISVGAVFRELAKERGMTVGEFNELASKQENIDRLIDSKVAQKAEEIISKERPNEVFIFDSRLAAFLNIEGAINVRTTVESKIAGQRIFGDPKRGEEDKYSSLEEAIKETELRTKCERERFIRIYGYDIQDAEKYNLVIDTSYSTIEDITQLIEQCLELELQGEKYSKDWTSPKKLLPLQNERQTISHLEEVIKVIEQIIYDPVAKIEIIEVEGRKYIIDGHHRNFARAFIGKSLVPYDVIARENEELPKDCGNTAKERAKSLSRGDLLGHESFFDIKDENGKIIEYFSYNQVYPGIYKELEEREGR